MTETSGPPPPGWYYAAGDPMGSQRYWNGSQWVGEPVWLPQPPPGYWMAGLIPGINRVLANPGKRIVARIIDFLIVIVVAVIPVMIWLLQRDDVQSDTFEGPGLAFTLLLSIPIALYEIAFIALKGATPGKLAMGITVIRQDGGDPPGWAASARRYVVNLVGLVPGVGGLASIVILIVSFVFLFTDDRRRTIPDRIALTYVVDTRRE
jgi:uncharacterized RDD family membrane protein YckC